MARSGQKLDPAIAVTRLGLGARPGEIAEASQDPREWLLRQIRPEGAETLAGAWPNAQDRLVALAGYRDQIKTLRSQIDGAGAGGAALQGALVSQPAPAAGLTSTALLDQKADFTAARRAAKQPLDAETDAEILARAQLAANTPGSFRERWTLFWSNHFTVASKNEEVQALAPVFEREAIRPNVFARFETLLTASTTHPAMLHYLDQVHSIGPDSVVGLRRKTAGLNENLAREILELHTVGADAGYSQADVTEFARALTGLTIGDGKPQDGELGRTIYRQDWREPGDRTVMGQRFVGDAPDAFTPILKMLATDPHTARRLTHKIAAHFLADNPPPSLCGRLGHAWSSTGGNLAHVAQILATSPEVWDPRPLKLKTPYEFLVSSWRAAGVGPSDVHRDVLNPLNGLGQRPFYAPQPNGWADVASAWAAPDAIMKRLYWSQGFAAAHAPAAGPEDVARNALGDRLSPASALAISRAASRPEAFALLVMTPEFQRR